jgi:hypothetical protein
MLVKRLVDTISDELNDREPGHEHVRWLLNDIFEYITEAIEQLALFKPDLFAVTQTIKLRPGAAQRIPTSIAKLMDVTNNIAVDGALGSPILRNDYNLIRYFNKTSCISKTATEVRSFSIDAANPRVFYVSPVEQYPDQYVQILGQSSPQMIGSIDDDIVFTGGDAALYFNAMKDWALYRAFMRDTESQTSLQRARMHYDAFYHLLGVKSSIGTNARTQQRQVTPQLQQPQQVVQDGANF